jgi:hypothetical protein
MVAGLLVAAVLIFLFVSAYGRDGAKLLLLLLAGAALLAGLGVYLVGMKTTYWPVIGGVAVLGVFAVDRYLMRRQP